MNEQLKFTWGHIIAFLGLIFISYTTYVGVIYLTNGDFTSASAAMIGIDIALLLVFIGAQTLKATDEKFRKRLLIERIMVFSSPIVFCLCLIPYFQFWTVYDQKETISTELTNALNASKQMFTGYENYSNKRLKSYKQNLDRQISSKTSKDNLLLTLRLQLLSDNYKKLKKSATEWIESSDFDASTGNIFVMGNIAVISDAIHQWYYQLHKNSAHIMSLEETKSYKVKLFDKTNKSLVSVNESLYNIETVYTTQKFPTALSLFLALLLYGALALPYCLQNRHTKSVHTLTGRKHRSEEGFSLDEEKEKADEPESEDEDEDEYGSFTM